MDFPQICKHLPEGKLTYVIETSPKKYITNGILWVWYVRKMLLRNPRCDMILIWYKLYIQILSKFYQWMPIYWCRFSGLLSDPGGWLVDWATKLRIKRWTQVFRAVEARSTVKWSWKTWVNPRVPGRQKVISPVGSINGLTARWSRQ